MKILTGHTSMETAYVVDDYPYGYTLRCKIRYWLEQQKRGFRFCSQTTNPRKLAFEKWNKPKKSIYCTFGVMLINEENGHVGWTAVNAAYSTAAELKAWGDQYADALPEPARKDFLRIFAAKHAYETNRKPGDPLNVGLNEARKAFIEG